MSVERRSALMARIRSKDTSPELAIRKELLDLRLEFECHPKDVAGCPDIVFRELRVAIFIDGDFWHGWRFPLWKNKLSKKWALKIEGNRCRDRRNIRHLRRKDWRVIRIWEHQVEQDICKCTARVMRVLDAARSELTARPS
jgi:DNA mismatch endonuclease (patch repair protein)